MLSEKGRAWRLPGLADGKPAGEAGRPKVERSLHPEKEEEELAPQELFAKPAAAGAAAPSTVQAAAK